MSRLMMSLLANDLACRHTINLFSQFRTGVAVPTRTLDDAYCSPTSVNSAKSTLPLNEPVQHLGSDG